MEGSLSTGQSPQWALVPVEEEEEESKMESTTLVSRSSNTSLPILKTCPIILHNLNQPEKVSYISIPSTHSMNTLM
jgi:hypothetical protein